MLSLALLRKSCLIMLTVSILLTISGCSISDSVGSISKSSGSFSDSSGSISDSSKSSGDDENDAKLAEKNRYENEVKDFTVTYLRTHSGVPDRYSFMKGISDVASQNGIVDWEANPKTYQAIGKGLKKANVSKIHFEMYKVKFTDGVRARMDDVQEGYDSDD